MWEGWRREASPIPINPSHDFNSLGDRSNIYVLNNHLKFIAVKIKYANGYPYCRK